VLKINDMTAAEFCALPHLDHGDFDSLVLAPTGETHESGFGTFRVFGCRDETAIGEITHPGILCDHVLAREMCEILNIDCLKTSGFMRIFPQKNYVFRLEISASSCCVVGVKIYENSVL